jgi:hypothetical protein
MERSNIQQSAMDQIQRHFESTEMDAYKAQLRETIQLQAQSEAKLSAKFAEAVRNNFQKSTVDELADLDCEDERLLFEYLRLYKAYAETAIDERRKQIGRAAHKAGQPDLLPSLSRSRGASR